MDDSAIICDEVIKSYDEEMKTIPTTFNEKNIIRKTQSFYTLLTFLSITIALFIAVSIYRYLIKYQRKQRHKIDYMNWKWVIKLRCKHKKWTYYFFNDIIDIENFDPDNIKIDEKSYKNILIYYIGYVTIKKDLKFYSVNPPYLIFRYINGYFEEINRKKSLTLVPNNESKEKKVWRTAN